MTEETSPNVTVEPAVTIHQPQAVLPPFTLTSSCDANGLHLLVVVRPPQQEPDAVPISVPVVNTLTYKDAAHALAELDRVRNEVMNHALNLAFQNGYAFYHQQVASASAGSTEQAASSTEATSADASTETTAHTETN